MRSGGRRKTELVLLRSVCGRGGQTACAADRGEEEQLKKKKNKKKKKQHCQTLDMKEMSKTFALVEVVEGDQIQLVRC